ncbi:sensor histidine kinase [Trichothermofontia sp.]
MANHHWFLIGVLIGVIGLVLIGWAIAIARRQFPRCQGSQKTPSAQDLQTDQDSILQCLLHYTPLAIAVFDTEMRYLFASDNWCRTYGLEPQILVGRSHYDLFPEIPDRWRAIHQQCLAGASEACDLDLFLRADGSVDWVKWAIYPWHTATGEVGGIIMITEVITSTEAKYQHLIENLHAGVVVHGADTRILLCNSMACELLGLTREQMLGKAAIDPAWHFSYEDGTLMPQSAYPVNQVIATGKPLKNLVVGIHRPQDANCTWVLVNAFPEVDTQQHLCQVVVTFIDITEIKQAEALLAQQTAQEKLLSLMAERIRQSLDLTQVLETTAHEICQFLRVDRVTIYRLINSTQGQAMAIAHLPAGEDTHTVATPSLPPVWVTVTGQELNIRDRCGQLYSIADPCAIEDCHGYQGLWVTSPIAALLTVPITGATGEWGVLVAQHRLPRPWQATEIQAIMQLLGQVSIAIQQSELYQQVQALNWKLEQEVQERTAQLQRSLGFEALLKRITDKVRDSLNEETILTTVVRELAEGLQTYSCDSDLFDLENATATIQYEYIRQTMPSALGQQAKMADFPGIYEVLLQGELLQFCWLEHGNPLRMVQERLVTLACPITDNQHCLGSIWLYRAATATFDTLEVHLVEQVANQCAIAIRQARLYSEVQAQVKALEQLHRLKDDFLSTVSHELRTPIANIKMATQMLELGLQKLQTEPAILPRLNQYLQILKDEGQRELSLINDLLDLSRLEAESEPLTLTALELRTWLPHLLEGFVDRAKSQNQFLKIRLPDTLPPLTTEVAFLERVIMELLNNACKYTPAEGEIILTASVQANRMQISLQNTGVEIAPEELPHIFEKFYRIPKHDIWKRGGTGLGLALVQKLIDRLGGEISVESFNHQVTFRIHLPLQSVPNFVI